MSARTSLATSSAAARAAASSPMAPASRPIASATQACRAAVTGRLNAITCGIITAEVSPWGTSQRAPSWWPMPWLSPSVTLARPQTDIQAATMHCPRAVLSPASRLVSRR